MNYGKVHNPSSTNTEVVMDLVYAIEPSIVSGTINLQNLYPTIGDKTVTIDNFEVIQNVSTKKYTFSAHLQKTLFTSKIVIIVIGY